jgi:hypothetical protein
MSEEREPESLEVLTRKTDFLVGQTNALWNKVTELEDILKDIGRAIEGKGKR